MSRWTAARDRLTLPDGSRVLDLGCAFGHGTRMLRPRFETYGHDVSSAYIDRARRSVPGVQFTCGPADRIPYPDAFFDGVVMLDVLEHVPDVDAVTREIRRVLRPGGQIIVSVPNAGTLASCDSLNVYHSWFGSRAAPPTDDPSWAVRPYHRHFSCIDIQSVFSDGFKITRVWYSGIGVAEPVNLLLLILFRRLLRWPDVYAAAQYMYFAVYLLEDRLRTGRHGYHMMLSMQRE